MPLSVAELDRLVRENQPNFRVYDWRQVEAWREEMAAVARQREQIAADLAALAEVRKALALAP